MDNSLYSNNSMSSPFKGDFNKAAERNAGLLDYEPYHTRSSFNLNYNSGTPVQNQHQQQQPQKRVEKETNYSADLLVSLLLSDIKWIYSNGQLYSSPTDQFAGAELVPQR